MNTGCDITRLTFGEQAGAMVALVAAVRDRDVKVGCTQPAVYLTIKRFGAHQDSQAESGLGCSHYR